MDEILNNNGGGANTDGWGGAPVSEDDEGPNTDGWGGC